AVELDVGEVELARLDLGRVLLVEVAVGGDLGVTVDRVGVKVELGVERLDPRRAAVLAAFEDQRVDLGKRRVGLHVARVEALEDVDRLRLRLLRDAHSARELARGFVAEARERVDEDADDLLRRLVRDLLDVHAAFARAHHCDLLRRAVGEDGEVVLLLDVGAFLDQEAPHLLPLRPGLVGDELHAEDLAGELRHLGLRARELDAAALAATAGVDLRLDDPDGAAELLRRLGRFADTECGIAARHGDAESGKDLLALVFVDLHRGSTAESGGEPARKPGRAPGNVAREIASAARAKPSRRAQWRRPRRERRAQPASSSAAMAGARPTLRIRRWTSSGAKPRASRKRDCAACSAAFAGGRAKRRARTAAARSTSLAASALASSAGNSTRWRPSSLSMRSRPKRDWRACTRDSAKRSSERKPFAASQSSSDSTSASARPPESTSSAASAAAATRAWRSSFVRSSSRL